jgi:kanamycin kinase
LVTFAVPDQPVPEFVAALAGQDLVEPVWLNELGGVTYQLGVGRSARFVKWQPPNEETSLAREARKLKWAAAYVTVPEVLGVGACADTEWLLTRALDGASAVSPRWRDDPARAVAAVGRGLREFHDRLPVSDCRWQWDPITRIDRAEARRICVPKALREPPPVVLAVVCHGDACCPNTVLADGGDVAGHVDLGSLGVADRWADIAVAAMSTEWNYGPGWESALLAGYGVAYDAVRMNYYQQLWNAT